MHTLSLIAKFSIFITCRHAVYYCLLLYIKRSPHLSVKRLSFFIKGNNPSVQCHMCTQFYLLNELNFMPFFTLKLLDSLPIVSTIL